MSLAVDIPKINITPDAEEDDDHIITNLSDALTDVEELYEDENKRQSLIINKKSKLKIKLTEDGDVTELEDFEGSFDEDEIKIVKYSKPIDFNKLDFEAPITEESYKKQDKGTGQSRVKTQFATKQKSFYQSISNEDNVSDDDIVTESEAYNTENEIKESDIPETEINLDLYKTGNLVGDDLVSASSTMVAAIFDNSDDDKNPIKLTTASPYLLNIFSNDYNDLTDVEVLHSDSDSEVKAKKGKTRRRKYRFQRKPSSTDLEDLYLSDSRTATKVIKKPKRKTSFFLVKSHSLAFDSDNEDNAPLPFPVCKPIAKKNYVSLRIPDFDTNFLTEGEDIEGDSDIENTELKFIDEKALEDVLQQMASDCGQVKEKNSETRRENQSQLAKTNTDIKSDKDETDEGEFQADDMEENKISVKEDSVAYTIRFSPSYANLKSKVVKETSHLILPPNMEDPFTDCENIDSSPEENELNSIPVACVQQQSLTENEEFTDDDISIGGYMQEIKLPLPTRNLVLIQENDALVPTVRILPLDNVNNDNEVLHDKEQATDEESFSEAEEALNLLNVEPTVRALTPELPMLDGDLINVRENVNRFNRCHSPVSIESVTDTEEVVLDRKHKRKRAPKFKYLHEKSMQKSKNIVSSPNDKNTLLTDTEELFQSDNPKDTNCANAVISLSVAQTANILLTDTENINLSGDEPDCLCNRSFSATPEHVKDMGGDTVFVKERSGPFSIIDKLELNRFTLSTYNTFVTPVTTDSEDLMVSAEEDTENLLSNATTATLNHIHQDLEASEKVMYLKGGGYINQHTDNESLYNEELLRDNSEDLVKKDYHLNKIIEKRNVDDPKNCLVAFGTEWDASRKPADITDQSALEQAVAQQGDDDTQPSGSLPGTSSAKAESEEGHDKTEKEKSKKVTDQTQLSDEMKELLKEMEKESKQ